LATISLHIEAGN